MGSRGPIPTERKTLKLRGSWRGKKKNIVPDLPSDLPTPPGWMPGAAMGIWFKLLPLIVRAGVQLTELDSEGLGRLCFNIFIWGKTVEFLEKNGLTYSSKNKAGHEIQRERPEVKILEQLNRDINTDGNYFGLSPSSRIRLRLIPLTQTKDKKLSKYFVGIDNQNRIE